MIHYFIKVHNFEHDNSNDIIFLSMFIIISKKQNNNHAFPEAKKLKKDLSTIRHSSV